MKGAFVLLTAALAVVQASGCHGSHSKYQGGKDTEEQFGDGRYEIIRCCTTLVLRDSERSQTLMRDLDSWSGESQWVYAHNQSGQYLILNVDNGESTILQCVDDAPELHRSKLRSLEAVWSRILR